jgi:hypothetical protein
MIRNNARGVSSFVSVLKIKPQLYTTMLRFFRSKAFSIENIYEKLIRIITGMVGMETLAGRVLVMADHIKIHKEGLKMPYIEKLHQESQNSGKGEYIEGHIFGIMSVLARTGKDIRSIPILGELHRIHDGNGSLVEKMAEMFGKAAFSIKKPLIGVCDAYFFSRKMLETIKGFVDGKGKQMVHIITRAKKNAVGYMPPGKQGGKKRGRPRMYGKRVSISRIFRYRKAAFVTTKLNLYGRETEVKYYCIDLIWKPVKRVVRFVLTEIDGKRFILMSSDSTLEGEEIIRAYAMRFKIEVMFEELKNELGGFRYHFWSKKLPRRRRGQASGVIKGKEIEKSAELAKKACEMFVCVQIITMSILTLLSIKQSRVIWGNYTGWLRTVRTAIPTLMVTKEVVSQEFHEKIDKIKVFPVFSAIMNIRRTEKFYYKAA